MRKHFAVIGNPISHSLSPVLFAKYIQKDRGNYHYSRLLLDDVNELAEMVKAFDIKAINVTSPFKNDVLDLVSIKSNNVKNLGVANTLLFENEIKAFNTDVSGVKKSLMKNGATKDNSALVLGAGGAAKAAVLALKKIGIEKIYVANRSTEKLAQFENDFGCISAGIDSLSNIEANILINTIPIYLDVFNEIKLKESTIVFDANYNNKPLYDLTKKKNAKYIDGIEWLKEQGKDSYLKMTGIKSEILDLPEDEKQKILSKSRKVALIGPMGSWKTSVGKKLAELLDFKFTDIDHLVEEKEGITIKEIFETKGEDYFRDLENLVLQEVLKKEDVIISTGGGIIKQDRNISLLKEKSWNILLYASPEECFSRINIDKRPLLKGKNVLNILKDLFEERKGKYYYTSDLVINTEQKTSKIITDILYEDYSKTFKI